LAAPFLLAAALCTGCIGNIGGADDGNLLGPGGPGGPGANGPVDVATSGLRRMTPAQYQNTLRDLVGDPGLTLDLDADEGEVITQLAVDKLRGAAAAVVARRGDWTIDPFPCDTSGADDAQCVEAFIRTFGRRAFRHTLADDEVQRLQAVFTKARASQSFDGALLAVLEVMLQSPDLYYFLELGSDPGQFAGMASGVRPLTGWERATRLSYFLWNTLPDDELLDAAEAGELDSIEGVRAQAERLATNDRGRDTFKGFFSDWLELDGTKQHASLITADKDPNLYPADSPELRQAMRIETEALVERVVFDGDGRFETLLTSNEAYVNAPLAALYGVDAPAGDAFEWVALPSDQRAGLLTRAAFLTVFASVEVKSPIRRGAHILSEVLCIELGPPPPNASDVPVKGGSVDEGGNVVNKTIREDVIAKTSSGDCNSCHSIINPVGFTFEHYDALGQWIETEDGEGEDGPYSLPIDASGALPGDGGKAVDGAVEMSRALGESAAAQSCLTKHFFESALRRVPIDADLASVDAATEVTQSGGTLTDLVVALATSNAFLHARLPEDDQ
jgi:hypothetical protein